MLKSDDKINACGRKKARTSFGRKCATQIAHALRRLLATAMEMATGVKGMAVMTTLKARAAVAAIKFGGQRTRGGVGREKERPAGKAPAPKAVEAKEAEARVAEAKVAVEKAKLVGTRAAEEVKAAAAVADVQEAAVAVEVHPLPPSLRLYIYIFWCLLLPQRFLPTMFHCPPPPLTHTHTSLRSAAHIRPWWKSQRPSKTRSREKTKPWHVLDFVGGGGRGRMDIRAVQISHLP
jgi:hypothetical protein